MFYSIHLEQNEMDERTWVKKKENRQEREAGSITGLAFYSLLLLSTAFFLLCTPYPPLSIHSLLPILHPLPPFPCLLSDSPACRRVFQYSVDLRLLALCLVHPLNLPYYPRPSLTETSQLLLSPAFPVYFTSSDLLLENNLE